MSAFGLARSLAERAVRTETTFVISCETIARLHSAYVEAAQKVNRDRAAKLPAWEIEKEATNSASLILDGLHSQYRALNSVWFKSQRARADLLEAIDRQEKEVDRMRARLRELHYDPFEPPMRFRILSEKRKLDPVDVGALDDIFLLSQLAESVEISKDDRLTVLRALKIIEEARGKPVDMSEFKA